MAVADSQPGSRRSLRGKASSGRSLNVVAIGGGTGLSTLLKGLKRYVTRPGAPGNAAALPKSANCAPWSRSATTAAPADACAKNSTCCRLATSATASSLSPKMRLCSPACFSIVSSRDGPGRPQLRQSVSGGVDLHHQRLRRSRPAVFGNSAYSRTHLSRHHFARRTRSPDGRWHQDSRRNQNHRQQRPHPATFSGSAKRSALTSDSRGHGARRPDHHRPRLAFYQPDSQSAGARHCPGHREFRGGKGLCRQPDDPGQREPRA